MTGKGSRILIVEDEESLQKLETILLTSKGYKVTAVGDGAAALAEISRKLPDLVILDIMLPGMDGFEVCSRIKGDQRSCRVPVIMLTARKNERDMERGLKAGAQEYITKPFKSAQLLGAIERILSSAARQG